jgi:hypothetical protein
VNFTIPGGFLVSEISIHVFQRGDQGRTKASPGGISNAVIMAVGLSSIVLGTAIGFLAKFRNIRWLFSPNYTISAFGLLLILIGVIIRGSTDQRMRCILTSGAGNRIVETNEQAVSEENSQCLPFLFHCLPGSIYWQLWCSSGTTSSPG